MDEKTFLNRTRAGEFLAVGEYRHSKCETINWRDKQTGRAMTAPVLRHTVEFGDQSVAVSERLPDNITKEEEVPPVKWKKGQLVVLRITELTRNLGLVSARGELFEFASSPGNGTPVGEGAGSRRS